LLQIVILNVNHNAVKVCTFEQYIMLPYKFKYGAFTKADNIDAKEQDYASTT